MNTRTLILTAMTLSLLAIPALAIQGHGSHDTKGHGMATEDKMDHSGMDGTYKHMASGGGMDAEFQVMSLASMNMASDKGETHHIMVNLKSADNGKPIKNAIGKIKVIAPDKSEQEGTLKNYSGILAANFTFKEPGKYGVICLLKNNSQKQVFKFWYPHQ